MPNAEYQQSVKPFHLILATQNPATKNYIITEADMHDGVDRWAVPREQCIPRTPQALANSIRLLLEISKSIIFVDPYFSPEMPRFQKTLREFVAVATAGGRILNRLEYHLDAAHHDNASWFAAECTSQLAPILPKGNVPLKIIRWRERPSGEELHARYILTERGGVRIERGLDSGAMTQTTDVSLLDYALYQQRWNNYQLSTAAFDLVDQTTVEGLA